MKLYFAGVNLHPIRSFLLYSNIHIPFLAVALVSSTAVFLRITSSSAMMIAAGAGSFLVYQVDRAMLIGAEDRVNQPERVRWYKQHSIYIYSSSACAITAGAISIHYLSLTTIILGVLLGMFGVAYLLPYGSNALRLKGHWLAKPVFITICWATGVVVLPVIESGGVLNGMTWSFFIYRALLIGANVILADLPDRKGDGTTHLATMAVILPQKVVLRLVIGLILLTIFIGLMHGIFFRWPIFLFVDLGGAIGMLLLAINAQQEHSLDSHFLYGYITDLFIGWCITSVIISYFVL